MSLKSWFIKIIEQKKQKEELKRKEDFYFLIEEIKKSENKMLEQFTQIAETMLESKVKNSIHEIYNNVTELHKQINEYNCTIQEHISNINEENISSNNKTNEVIKSIVKKLEEMEYNKTENLLCIENKFNDYKSEVTSTLEEIKHLLKIIAVNYLIDEINIEE